MEHIKSTFAKCKREERAAFVAYTTAGFPEHADGVEVMLALEAGGAGKGRNIQLIKMKYSCGN